MEDVDSSESSDTTDEDQVNQCALCYMNLSSIMLSHVIKSYVVCR
jgi:hypothetical protein